MRPTASRVLSPAVAGDAQLYTNIDTLLSEAPGAGKTIFEYARRSRGAEDYALLAKLVEEMPPLEKEEP